jgi:C-terminal processing protease CtpA/Prc
LLRGNGKAWLDDVKIEIIGDGGEGNQPATELTQRQLENVTALARLVGYVRFFHPTKTVARTNWDLFTINAIRHVEDADSPKRLSELLNDVFYPVAPNVRIDVTSSNLHLPETLSDQESDSKVRFWMHIGVNLNSSRSIYSSKQRTAANARVFNLTPIRADLGGGVATLVPTAIPTKDLSSFEGSAFKRLHIKRLPHDWQPSSDDRSTRFAAVISTWNVIQHFYPYFDVVDIDWTDQLARALVRSATDKSESDFFETLERLIAPLRDGHGTVIPNNVHEPSRFAHKHVPPPVAFTWVGESIVVTAIGEEVDKRLRVGDVVTEINGESIETLVDSLRDRISAPTDGFLRFVMLARLVHGPIGSKFTLRTCSPTGEEHEISLERMASSNPSQMIREVRPKQGSELANGVIYLDLTRMNHIREFKRLLPKLTKARGIVFDLRGYAGFQFRDLVSHLIDEPVTSPQWHVPVVRHADQTNTKYLVSNWQVKPRAPRLTKNVAFITDSRAISAAETLMGIIEHYKLAEIVGEPTAGTNGDVNPIKIPGGYTIVWTGLRVLKHDGSRHHGVGIHPTIPVTRTIEGIADGRDEFLERAVETLVQNVEQI